MKPEDAPAIIGVEKCGCVTYANSDPDHLDKTDQAAHARILSRGGQILRTTVGECRSMPTFLPAVCPHTPQGWAREEPKPLDPILYRKTMRQSGGTAIRRVEVRIPGWERRGFPAGEVRKRNGKWWATEGWFNHGEAEGANRGDNSNGKPTPCDELGPFTSMRAAAEALIPGAEERGKQMRAQIQARDKAMA